VTATLMSRWGGRAKGRAMTAVLTSGIENRAAATPRKLNIISAWLASIAVYFSPRRYGERWLGISVGKAAVVAVVNLLLAVPWFVLAAIMWTAWSDRALRELNALKWHPDAWQRFTALFKSVPHELFTTASQITDPMTRLGIIVGVVVTLLIAFAVTFFVLLPFAARPGSNDACFKHTARTALLASGAVNIVFPLFSLVFISLPFLRFPSGFENALTPIMGAFGVVSLWALAALIVAVRADYRRPKDMPTERDPLCEECGYDLRMAEMDGRCPECGKLVAESLSDDSRQRLSWETQPSLLNVSGVMTILRHILLSPRAMFFGMLTRAHQAQAQRWLLLWVTVVGMIAYWSSPATVLTGAIELTYRVFVGGIALAVVWAVLALMMVGIETAGITAFARWRGHKIEVASAAKVTAYTSPLLVVWVILGSVQILGMLYWYSQNYSRVYGIRMEQFVFTLSTAVAHIGGLLWFELVVYRGVRAIQFARR